MGQAEAEAAAMRALRWVQFNHPDVNLADPNVRAEVLCGFTVVVNDGRRALKKVTGQSKAVLVGCWAALAAGIGR